MVKFDKGLITYNKITGEIVAEFSYSIVADNEVYSCQKVESSF